LGPVVAGSRRQTGLIAAVLLADDRGDRLRRQVTADQQDVGIVELRGGQELPEGNLRPVEVSREQQPLEFSLRSVGPHLGADQAAGSYRFGRAAHRAALGSRAIRVELTCTS